MILPGVDIDNVSHLALVNEVLTAIQQILNFTSHTPKLGHIPPPMLVDINSVVLCAIPSLAAHPAF